MSKLLFENNAWTYDTIRRIHDACEEVAVGEMGLSCYPNQIEIITTEQMLDSYSSIGMPLFYKHWSFGKHFAVHQQKYRRGLEGLAYEIVINSSPCISYIMEDNTATMQALVIAHAAFGHNHFFKNNYLFKQWTEAEGILDYLQYAKSFIEKCEERYGQDRVEKFLDATHALMEQGVHKYPGRKRKSLKEEAERREARKEYAAQTYQEIWRTIPQKPQVKGVTAPPASVVRTQERMGLPEENVLYFIEKYAPLLAEWQREVVRIVRNIAQYFYPQGQTKVMNEGTASWVHYKIMNRLHEKGQLSDGNFLEFLQSHTSVVQQPSYRSRYYQGRMNPYYLGFNMMRDIERIVEDPTREDEEWFPTIAGKGNSMSVLKDAWENYRDDSFILQFLSPKLIREMRLFHVAQRDADNGAVVENIHDEDGYKKIRHVLSKLHERAHFTPNIEVTEVDVEGDRTLHLSHRFIEKALDSDSADTVLGHLADLWGYEVEMNSYKIVSDATSEKTHSEEHYHRFSAKPSTDLFYEEED